MVASALPMAETLLPPRSMTLTLRSNGEPVVGSVRCTSLLKNWFLSPRSYLMPSSSTSVRSTKMILAWIESCGVRMSSPRTKSVTFCDPAPGVGDDERVGAGVGHDAAAALGQDALDRLGQRAGVGVVDPHDAGLQRLERVERGEHRGRIDPDDAAGHLLGREALAGEDRLEGHRPGLVLDLGGDLTLDVLAEDDGAAAEGREAGDHVGDAGAVPGHRDPGLVHAAADHAWRGPGTARRPRASWPRGLRPRRPARHAPRSTSRP